MPKSQQLIQVFARTPIMGRVKSRLAKQTSLGQALHVHRRLLTRTISAAEACRLPVQYWSADSAGFYRESWMNRAKHKHRRRQCRGDLGLRMHQALQNGLDTARAVILIGSDCPEISSDYLSRAFQVLKQYEVVIGPATDGGYVLIGLRGVSSARSRELFRKVSWGSDQVFLQTRAHLQRSCLSWACLPPLSDLDHAEDLTRFTEQLRRRDRSIYLSQESGVYGTD